MSSGSARSSSALPRIGDFSVSISIGRPANRAIVQQAPERLETETALADVLVPIDAAAARALRVVGVKGAQPIEADEPIERSERLAHNPHGLTMS